MATVTENLKLLTTSTMDEDKQFLTEVIEEIKIKKQRGRPRIYTQEEAKERIKAYDRRRYHADPEKKKS